MDCNNTLNSLPSLYPCPLQGSFAALPIKGWSLFPQVLNWCWPCDLLWPIHNAAQITVCSSTPSLKRHGSHLPSLPTMWTTWAWWKPTSRKALLFWGHSRSTSSQPTPKPFREPSKISRATCPSHRWPQMHAWGQQDQKNYQVPPQTSEQY